MVVWEPPITFPIYQYIYIQLTGEISIFGDTILLTLNYYNGTGRGPHH